MTSGKRHGLRVGVVGIGHWGSKHMRVLGSVPEVSALCAVDLRVAEMRSVSAYPRVFATLEEALPFVDAVIIATPPSSHAALGAQALAAGKHTLVEKPLATTTKEAVTLVETADAAGVVLMTGHTFEHNAAVHHLRDLIVGRELGDLYYLDCARLNLGLYQSDVNVVMDLAPHDISITNFVLRSQPSTVTAWGSRHIHPELEDVAYLRLDYEEVGVRANIHVSWLDPSKVRRVKAVGSKRMAVYDDMAGDERIRIYHKAVAATNGNGPLCGVAYHRGGMEAPFVAFSEPLAVQDQQFLDCALHGVSPAADGLCGLAVVKALECAQISLEEQRPVRLDELDVAPQIGSRPPSENLLTEGRRG